jgi:alkylated DNA nucleotide flippase Atl1
VEPSSPAADIVITAQNQNVNDVDVFLIANGHSRRLGTITSQSAATFQVPWSQVANSTRTVIRADPVGSNAAYRSQNLVLRPGSQVSVTLNSIIRNSVTTVY